MNSYINDDIYNNWYNINNNVLTHLYYELLIISKKNNIIIYDNKNTYQDFLYMMYVNSNKTVVSYEDYCYYENIIVNT